MAHRTRTSFLHSFLLLAFLSIVPQVYPLSFISFSMVCLHVVFGLPLFLFPSGVHLRATFVMSSDGLCRTWPSHQTYQNYSSRGLEEELYCFEAIRNSRWLSWPLISGDISTSPELARNVPVGILKKCCCFSEQFKIQHGCPSLYWLRRFLLCFPKLLHLKSPDFP